MTATVPQRDLTDGVSRAIELPPLTGAALDHRERQLPARTEPWRRLFKQRRFMHHNRLVALVLVANAMYAIAWALGDASVEGATYAVLVNFALTALVRQQRVVNLFFRVATAAPVTWPLRVRWSLGKVYHFGGLHVGGAIATSAWFFILTAMVFLEPTQGRWGQVARGLSLLILTLLLGMVATAIPRFRARFHDKFEMIHRFAGWTALGLFGMHSVVVAVSQQQGSGDSLARTFFTSPAVWVFLLVLCSVSSTWWDLRLVPVTYEKPSNHVVIARFAHRTTFAGSSTALSRDPLREWHHFANVHTAGQDGFRLTISRAGDWTGSLIDDLPERLWVKGIPTAGVGNIDALFSKVLWVATGSGIGPCLPHLLSGDTPAGLVWSTRDPLATYGGGLVQEILDVQPEATIWDTTAHGKPDLVKLAFAVQEQIQAEAVICISNKPTTWSVVEAFEERGIPAYGAIWDS
ncbi:hypothetical protein [Demetria terragena]|uniref:hypothetical protein n=1 Tax=Demetria terragena TaxID=63959 RepID=UPI00035E4588|nr:hypothetical protein [Demetria terragena]